MVGKSTINGPVPRGAGGMAARLHWSWRAFAVLAIAFAFSGPALAQEGATGGGLTGRLLVAAPTLRDPNFFHTVIYIVQHDPGGALGIVVNRVLGTGPAAQVRELFGLRDDGAEGELRVYAGGPVQPSSGLVLHSPDYVGEGTTVVNEDFALTSDAEVVRAIARGEGPRNSLIAFGYAGWGPGQLDDEIAQEAWVDVPADEAIVFDDDLESKWRRAFALRSVDL